VSPPGTPRGAPGATRGGPGHALAVAELLIRGAAVVDPEGGVEPRSILVRGERIAGILAPDVPPPAGVQVLDARGLHVFPGVVEPHAHLGYGGADMAGHFESETASAALGGITTVINIYRQYGRAASPYDELGGALRACEARARVDFAVHLALLLEDHVRSIPRYVAEHGIRSFKFYMAYRGEDGRQIGMTNEIDDGLLVEALSAIAAAPGGVACFHCENTEVINRVARRLRAEGRQGLAAWSASRPAYAEAESIHRAAVLGAAAGFSLWEGWPLRGWPVLTMVRGSVVMDKGEVVGKPGFGRYLPR